MADPAFGQEKIFAVFDGNRDDANLPALAMKLITGQRETWDDLRIGYAQLKNSRNRTVACGGYSVRLFFNALRTVNTLAAVGEKEITQRPCFLCIENLPKGQKGIFYRGRYLILCNPRPVVSLHMTVAHVTHQQQAISGKIDDFLHLMTDFGPGWTVLYNGPQCGASAPDHLHFQAMPSGVTPVEREITDRTRLDLVVKKSGTALFYARGLGRRIAVIEGTHRENILTMLGEYIGKLNTAGNGEEPMINIAGFYADNQWRVLVFPRRKHRPAVFFEKGDRRITVSPAVMEMMGVFVTPFEKDFKCLDASDVESIYREVSLL